MTSALFARPETVKLNLRPVPIEGEAWADYLSRLAQDNCLHRGIVGLAHSARISLRHLIVGCPATTLERFGVSFFCISESVTSAERMAASPFLSFYGRTLRTRICPLCFKDDGSRAYVRAEWGMPMSISCRVHETLLVDQCHTCGHSLDVLRPSLTHCRCGADLRREVAEPCGPWVERLAVLFKEAYQAQPVCTFARAHQIGRQAARTCRWLAEAHRGEIGSRSVRFRESDSFLSLADARGLSCLLHDWPGAAAQALALSVGRDSAFAHEKVTDRIDTHLFAGLRELRDAIRYRLRAGLTQGTVRKLTGGRPSSVKKKIGIKDLMSVTGHSYGTLLRCIEDGGVPGASYAHDHTTGRKSFEISKEVFDSIAQTYRQTDGLDTAAVQIGCSPAAMRGLVRSECIPANKLALTTYGRMRHRVCPVELRQFANYLFDLALVHEVEARQVVPFSEWVPGEYCGSRAQRWRTLIVAVRQRAIPLWTSLPHPVRLDQLLLRAEDIERVLESQAA